MKTERESLALQAIHNGGGMLYPFLHGYEKLAVLLDQVPRDEWRKDEAVLGCLILYLVKNGHAVRAKSYLYAARLDFEKTYRFDVLDLLLELHLGEPVSTYKLTKWRRLERTLPVSQPLMLGLYYNAMTAMAVRLNRLEDGRVYGLQAISCYREHGHTYLEHFIHIHLAGIDVIEGHLHRARRSLAAAESCLALSKTRYGNESEVVEIVRLSVDYECGKLQTVRRNSARLRESLLNGDSWSELFFQLARISVLSAYFLDGRVAAQQEIEVFRADYARRHSGVTTPIDAMHALIHHLEWHPDAAERSLKGLKQKPMHSSIGDMFVDELEAMIDETQPRPDVTPRGAIVAALERAHNSRGKARKSEIENAIRLAFAERQMAPFLEHRDVFFGISSKLADSKFDRGNRSLGRFAKMVVRMVERSYVVPDVLEELGLNRRQYRVAAALRSGASNKQIARQLGSSEATVKYHLTNLYKMTGSIKRSELIDFMEENEVFEVY